MTSREDNVDELVEELLEDIEDRGVRNGRGELMTWGSGRPVLTDVAVLLLLKEIRDTLKKMNEVA